MAYPCGLPLSAPRGQGGLPSTTVIRCTRGESAASVRANVCACTRVKTQCYTYVGSRVLLAYIHSDDINMRDVNVAFASNSLKRNQYALQNNQYAILIIESFIDPTL